MKIEGRANTPAEKGAVLKMIEVAWNQMPSLRLGQLLCNAHQGDLFYVEDEDLAKDAASYANDPQEHSKKVSRKLAGELDKR